MKIKPSHYDKVFYYEYEKIPRKLKKALFGRVPSKKQLRNRIKNRCATDYFCPDCGCEFTRSTGNMTEYPEVYEKSYCLRCGRLVCVQDNSLPMHILDDPDFYEI